MVKLEVTNEAAHWYKKELHLSSDEQLRLFVRFGDGGIVPGFSLGIRIDQPNEVLTTDVAEGICFFIEESDAWYFEDVNLKIELDQQNKEPRFKYS